MRASWGVDDRVPGEETMMKRTLASPLVVALSSALVIGGCAAAPPWINANPQANLNADSQQCRNAMTRPMPMNSAACDRNPASNGCNTMGALSPQDDAWLQTNEYETCMGRRGWHR